MIINVSRALFKQCFMNSGCFEEFGNIALDRLFDYYEEMEEYAGIQIECDAISICCEWGCYDERFLFMDFGYLLESMEKSEQTINTLIEELENYTIVLEFETWNKNHSNMEKQWLVQAF